MISIVKMKIKSQATQFQTGGEVVVCADEPGHCGQAWYQTALSNAGRVIGLM